MAPIGYFLKCQWFNRLFTAENRKNGVIVINKHKPSHIFSICQILEAVPPIRVVCFPNNGKLSHSLSSIAGKTFHISFCYICTKTVALKNFMTFLSFFFCKLKKILWHFNTRMWQQFWSQAKGIFPCDFIIFQMLPVSIFLNNDMLSYSQKYSR